MTGRVGLCHVEQVMGTRVTIDVRDPVPPEQLNQGVSAAVRWLHWVDRTFSRFRAESALSLLGRGEVALADCPVAVADVLALARFCQERTGGAFDPSWRADGTVDPTGLVKGWAAQQASDALLAIGLRHHCVNAAGDVRVRGESRSGRIWAIGVDHPLRPGHLIGVVEGSDLAVATSGVAQQGTHIVDTRTGRAASVLASVTVVGPDLARADAYATAGIALGHDAVDLLEDLDGEGWTSLVVFADGRVWSSAHFTGRVASGGLSAVPAR